MSYMSQEALHRTWISHTLHAGMDSGDVFTDTFALMFGKVVELFNLYFKGAQRNNRLGS